MKIYFVLIFIVSALITLFSCNSKSSQIKSEIDATTYEKYLNKGDNISTMAQSVLLTNVGKAIKQGGTEYAVEFCNLHVSSITDSLNIANDIIISRVTDKNRNPRNKLKSEDEQKLWDVLTEGNEFGKSNDTLVRINQKLVYYKPIKTAMPACLKCHGSVDTDIEPATLTKIQKLYPNDLATGYQLNDFRGLWKIEFLE